MANALSEISAVQLRRALAIKEKIETLERQLSRILNGNMTNGATQVAPPAPPRKAKRKMSAKARAKIAAAQKKRWAAVKAKKAA
jgi:hypothetical protein